MQRLTAIIYARVSTDEQQDNYSLPSQLQACRDYADQHGYTVVGEYSDAFTGTTLNRPQLNSVTFQAGTFDALIVHSVSRLSRDPVDLLVLNDTLQKAGTAIRFVNDAVDTSTDLGKVMLHLEGLGAKKYRETMLEQMTRGKRERVRSGKVILGHIPPYGYKRSEDGTRLEVDAAQAAIVQQIFQWYVYGDDTGQKLGTQRIAKRLTQLAIPTAHDDLGIKKKVKHEGVWAYSSVIKILSNEAYTGCWQYGSHRHKRKSMARPEPITVAIPVIISIELFRLARQQADYNKCHALRNTQAPYLLRQRCTCAKCGYRIYGKTDHRYGRNSYYYCNGTLKHESADGKHATCSGIIQQDKLETNVWNAIKEALKRPDKIMRMIELERQDAAQRVTSVQSYLTTCEQQLADLEQYRHNLISDYTRRRIPDDFYDKELPQVEQQIVDCHSKIADYRTQLVASQRDLPTSVDVEAIRQFGNMNLDNATYEDKLITLDALNIQVVVDRENDRLEITGYFPTIVTTLSSGRGSNSAAQFTLYYSMTA